MKRGLKDTPAGRACRDEIAYMLADPRGRRFLWRILTELCQLDVTSFPQNAGIYALCGKQQVGRILLRACREIDLEKTQQAECEYYALLDDLRRDNAADNTTGGYENE